MLRGKLWNRVRFNHGISRKAFCFTCNTEVIGLTTLGRTEIKCPKCKGTCVIIHKTKDLKNVLKGVE